MVVSDIVDNLSEERRELLNRSASMSVGSISVSENVSSFVEFTALMHMNAVVSRSKIIERSLIKGDWSQGLV